ncbi:unnamed protein product [Lampetra fluviatilis]
MRDTRANDETPVSVSFGIVNNQQQQPPWWFYPPPEAARHLSRSRRDRDATRSNSLLSFSCRSVAGLVQEHVPILCIIPDR